MAVDIFAVGETGCNCTCGGGFTCLPCSIPKSDLTLSITVGGSTQHCFDCVGNSEDCGLYIIGGSETLHWNGLSAWISNTPEAFICSGCTCSHNALADSVHCLGGVVTLGLFGGGSLLVSLNFSQASSYTCSPFTASWTITLAMAGTAYTYGLRTVTLSG